MSERGMVNGHDQLAAARLVAVVAAAPSGVGAATPASTRPDRMLRELGTGPS